MDESVKEFTRKLICTYLEEGDKNEEFEFVMIETLCRDREEDLLLLCLIPPDPPTKNVFTLNRRIIGRLYTYPNPPIIRLPWSLEQILDQCAMEGDIITMEMLLEHNPSIMPSNSSLLAVRYGRLEFLRRFIDKFTWIYDRSIVMTAIQYGQIHILEWRMTEYNEKYSKTEYTSWALQHGQLEVLKWLKSRGCPISTYAYDTAAANQKLQILQWLLENTSSWYHWMFSLIQVGNLDRLKWINSLSLPTNHVLSEAAFEMAWEHQQIQILDWLFENKCPIDPTNLESLGRDKTFRWAQEHGLKL